jgi:hypothetical protein
MLSTLVQQELQWCSLIKVPVVNRADYTMYLELYEGMLWFHTDVHKWTAKIKAKYLEDLNLLQYLNAVPLVAMLDQSNHKLIKFAKSIGFKYEQPFKGNDNEIYEIYSRSI